MIGDYDSIYEYEKILKRENSRVNSCEPIFITKGEIMTKKRFTLKQGFNDELDYGVFLLDNGKKLTTNDVVELLNALNDENEQLKQSNKDAIQLIKNEFDFAYGQRQKHLDDPVVCNAYDIIRYTMKKALEKLGDVE